MRVHKIARSGRGRADLDLAFTARLKCLGADDETRCLRQQRDNHSHQEFFHSGGTGSTEPLLRLSNFELLFVDLRQLRLLCYGHHLYG